MKGNGVSEPVDCVVIGAGVVGLAIARRLALAGRDVLVLEAANAIGTGISSRNSEVIHAGMYYPTNSLRATLCVEGNALLRDYAASRGVDFRMVGKLIVSADSDEETKLEEILAKGKANGIQSLVRLSRERAKIMEPDLSCSLAVWSPDTGIIDSHGLMVALQADLERAGGQVVLNAPVVDGEGTDLHVGGAESMTLRAQSVVIAAGLSSPSLARKLGLKNVPQEHLCKGNYFSLTGKSPFSHLVYPVPVRDGLGIHYTLDLQGRGRFGPDVDWCDQERYEVDESRASLFALSIKRYWPGVEGRELCPAYAGIRPKIYGPDEQPVDFMISQSQQHGVLGIVALYGIESPGLTCSLALAQMVAEMMT
jgi:L-2-hydroxyglutarate oxidase LhgO